ncbi:MAG: hypothetical protein U0992_00830 [Planctomycetaceae bacterium]
MLIPTVPLDELYGDRVRNWLEQRGSHVRTGAAVRAVVLDQNRIAAVELRDGERLTGGEFVVAVPHWRVAEILPPELSGRPEIQRLGRIETAPDFQRAPVVRPADHRAAARGAGGPAQPVGVQPHGGSGDDRMATAGAIRS